MPYTAVTIEGGFLAADLLERVGAGDATGQRPEDFGLSGRRLSDEIQSAFSDARAYWDTFQRRLRTSRESRTTLTRQAWLEPLLERLGFDLVWQRSVEAGGETYAISHRAGEDPLAPPVLLAGIDQLLDRRGDGVRRSPHATVQEYLNRSDALWGLAASGERLRLLRDSSRVARPVYLEVDLRAVVESSLYSDFALVYRLLHRSRFPRGAGDAAACLLEAYFQEGIEAGGRVRERLRDGVERALEELGTAFVALPHNTALRERLAEGTLTASAYYRQLLRLVYRLLFLFVAEERRLVLPPTPEAGDAGDAASRHDVYTRHYAASRLRERCERYFAGDRHTDLWAGLRTTFLLFRDAGAAARLGLTALNGELFGPFACPDLEAATCENAALLRGVYHLSTFADGAVRRRVNYAALDVEELGSVYESLLDYRPHVSPGGHRESPRFQLVAGSERRQTGSYYTPPELVRELIDHALVPVMEERLAAARTREAKMAALLDLKVCDPAAGSGHFLLAAARRIGRELARLRTEEEEPAPEQYRLAVRDVIRSCVYAVDKNPLAVDLCKVALWMESHSAGLPLSFLDHHVRWGDSLVGVADLKVLDEGIPDEAYRRADKEQAKAARFYRDRNKREREKGVHQLTLDGYAADEHLRSMGGALDELIRTPDDTPRRVAEKAARYEASRGQDSNWWVDTTACHMWTAPFFLDLQPDDPGVPTTGTLRAWMANYRAAHPFLPSYAWKAALNPKHPFFHWPLEFPEVFLDGGFDVVLGNPPFLGGTRISTVLGGSYRHYLATTYAPAGDRADLCAYFLRRAGGVLRQTGHLGLVATNTIGQGDTRTSGLSVLTNSGFHTTLARRFIKWEGAANVEVSLVTLRRGAWQRMRVLDGTEVTYISTRLDAEPDAEPTPLGANAGAAFIGNYVMGTGFLVEPAEARSLIDQNIQSAACLFPYLNGEDLNRSPGQVPTRWVISFGDRTEVEAQRFTDLWRIALERIRPERLGKDAKKYPSMVGQWWKHWRTRDELYASIAPLARVLVKARVSELHALAFVPRDWVYSDQTVVFAFDDDYHFALLQSNVHEAWVRRNASTMRTDIRYTPTDCFDTFPFPQHPPAAAKTQAEKVGATYHEHRRQTMLARQLGLTKTYNLFHSPGVRDSDVQRLRELHAEMDHAILACYGWDDLDPGHGFHQNERGQTRFTVSPEARREINRRLLDLNLRIAREEEARAALAR